MGVNVRFFAKILCCMALCVVGGGVAHGAGVLSQHGQIQNAQNYSSNPFWTPNGPYNQKMPQPVYVSGPNVDTNECQTIVFGLIAAICASQNNCQGKRVVDIRPAVMLDLSRIPGQNYATSCAGYLDSAFKQYQDQYINTITPTAFPTGNMPAVQEQQFQMQDPYIKKTPQWLKDKKEREQELQELQAQNGVGSEHVERADFPKTINDVSLTDRIANLTAGYEPFKDGKAFAGIDVEKKEDAMQRQANTQKLRLEMCEAQYGAKLADLRQELDKLNKCLAQRTPLAKCN